ncbi:MAG: FecR domain-containing protein [Candidatus Riflebacteria bacterium]|nr:FecR domain-containing protein [Candidatus Riflebacteria bacterium]
MNLAMSSSFSQTMVLPKNIMLAAIDEVKLKLTDTASIHFLPNSTFKLSERAVDFQGIASFKIAPTTQSFQVLTPSVEVTVIGTEFLVAASTSATIIDLIQGTVTLKTNAEKIILKAGNSAFVSKDAPIKVFPTTKKVTDYSLPELNKNFSNVFKNISSDSTFLQKHSHTATEMSAITLQASSTFSSPVLTSSSVLSSSDRPQVSSIPYDTELPTSGATGSNPTEVLGQ